MFLFLFPLQPVLVTNVHNVLDKDLWTPQHFKTYKNIGNEKQDCVDTRTDTTTKISMKVFWEGFEDVKKRTKDSKTNETKIMKLKDWPPCEEFSQDLPHHFQDLMSSIPIQEYTRLQGGCNMAGRLPERLVRPDLGPKLYVAYGPATPENGTTKLHLDISDAVNTMCYVGIPKTAKGEAGLEREMMEALGKGGCDPKMLARCKEKGVRVGALWHIYDARDADKMRDFMNKVSQQPVEQGGRGEKLNRSADPIHDQTWYLDDKLRTRLKKEYDVEGYAIIQCLGDAVFIPAGAPHQVFNLNSCIKVAGDFVSPENVAHCFNLTEQFRRLSDSHLNHQDKLQIKNNMFHAVKDALSAFLPKDLSRVAATAKIEESMEEDTDDSDE